MGKKGKWDSGYQQTGGGYSHDQNSYDRYDAGGPIRGRQEKERPKPYDKGGAAGGHKDNEFRGGRSHSPSHPSKRRESAQGRDRRDDRNRTIEALGPNDEWPLPRRYGSQIPDAQLVVLGEVDR